MGVAELFVAVLIVGVSAVNAGPPIAAWVRSKDARFLLLSGANGVLAVLGAIWAWGQLPVAPPAWTSSQLAASSIVLLAAALLLASTIWSRRA